MNRENNVYIAESDKSVPRFVEDFITVARTKDFLINNLETMDMKKTFRAHGGEVPDDFDLHMIQVCKPTKADKSLSSNPERAILMPKFVHVFTAAGKTQIRYLSHGADDIAALVPDDPAFPDSLAQTHAVIHAMIDEAK